MSNEITASVSLMVSQGELSSQRSKSASIDMTGDAIAHIVQEIGTANEEVVIGADLGTYGYVLLVNLDTTNYIEVGIATGVYAIKLKAKEVALFRVDTEVGDAIFAKANTAACDLEVFLIED